MGFHIQQVRTRAFIQLMVFPFVEPTNSHTRTHIHTQMTMGTQLIGPIASQFDPWTSNLAISSIAIDSQNIVLHPVWSIDALKGPSIASWELKCYLAMARLITLAWKEIINMGWVNLESGMGWWIVPFFYLLGSGVGVGPFIIFSVCLFIYLFYFNSKFPFCFFFFKLVKTKFLSQLTVRST